MKKVFFIFVSLLALMASINCMAEYESSMEISHFYITQGGTLLFSTTSIPDAGITCSSWGYHYKFNCTTDGGKSLLSLFLSAKMSQSPINVWFTPSTAPGTDQNSGCTISTMAEVTSIGMN